MDSMRNEPMGECMKQQGGFTLIELMIVVVIIGIITTIAVQSYSGATQDGERARIIAELNSLNDALGRFYQGSYSYEGAADGSNLPVATVRGTIEQSKQYTVTLVHPAGPDYQNYFLIAKPLGSGIMQGTGTYTMSSTGQRCFFPGNDSADPEADGCPKTW